MLPNIFSHRPQSWSEMLKTSLNSLRLLQGGCGSFAILEKSTQISISFSFCEVLFNIFLVFLVLGAMHGKLILTCTVQGQNACRDDFVQSVGLTLDEHGIPILFKKGATVSDHTILCK